MTGLAELCARRSSFGGNESLSMSPEDLYNGWKLGRSEKTMRRELARDD